MKNKSIRRKTEMVNLVLFILSIPIMILGILEVIRDDYAAIIMALFTVVAVIIELYIMFKKKHWWNIATSENEYINNWIIGIRKLARGMKRWSVYGMLCRVIITILIPYLIMICFLTTLDMVTIIIIVLAIVMVLPGYAYTFRPIQIRKKATDINQLTARTFANFDKSKEVVTRLSKVDLKEEEKFELLKELEKTYVKEAKEKLNSTKEAK